MSERTNLVQTEELVIYKYEIICAISSFCEFDIYEVIHQDDRDEYIMTVSVKFDGTINITYALHDSSYDITTSLDLYESQYLELMKRIGMLCKLSVKMMKSTPTESIGELGVGENKFTLLKDNLIHTLKTLTEKIL